MTPTPLPVGHIVSTFPAPPAELPPVIMENEILYHTATVCRVTITEIVGTSRRRRLVEARTLVVALLRERCNMGQVRMGHVLRRDHSTICTAERRHKALMQTTPEYRALYYRVTERIDRAWRLAA